MKSFLQQTIASILGTLVGLTIFAGGSLLGLIGLITFLAALSSSSEPVALKGRSMLALDLSLAIRDEPGQAEDSIDRWLSDRPRTIPLRVLLDTLAQAAKDRQITGLYLYDSAGTGPIAGYATLREVREAILEFRKKKPVIAYGTDWDERTYYLTSAANETRLHPAGGLEFNGLAAESTFWSGALEKYGIGVQFVRAGKFKSAVEPFARRDFSPENRAQTAALLQDLWQTVLTATGQSRKQSIAQLQAIADQGGLLRSDQAVKLGLVDRLAYDDQVIERVLKLADREDNKPTFQRVAVADYARQVGTVEAAQSKLGDRRKNATGQEIALLYATGTMVTQTTDGERDAMNGTAIATELRKLRKNEDVKAIVLRIDSPGGSATAADIIAREVSLAAKDKPVIVSMGDVAASGGYWIAAPATEIWAEPTTIAGSIGVFGLLPNIQKLGENNGVNWDAVTTAPFANIGSVTRSKTPAELALLQSSVDWTYDRFLDHVAQSRSIGRAKVEELAQGRIWSGKAAADLGLVDQLGGLDQAIAAAAKAAKLGKDWVLAEYPRREPFGLSWLEDKSQALWSRLGWSQSPLIARSLAQLPSQLWLLNDDPRSTYVWWPDRLEIR